MLASRFNCSEKNSIEQFHPILPHFHDRRYDGKLSQCDVDSSFSFISRFNRYILFQEKVKGSKKHCDVQEQVWKQRRIRWGGVKLQWNELPKVRGTLSGGIALINKHHGSQYMGNGIRLGRAYSIRDNSMRVRLRGEMRHCVEGNERRKCYVSIMAEVSDSLRDGN